MLNCVPFKSNFPRNFSISSIAKLSLKMLTRIASSAIPHLKDKRPAQLAVCSCQFSAELPVDAWHSGLSSWHCPLPPSLPNQSPRCLVGTDFAYFLVIIWWKQERKSFFWFCFREIEVMWYGRQGKHALCGSGEWSEWAWKEKQQTRTRGAQPASVSQAYLL